MDELIRTFRHFLVRDAIYIVGGGVVVASFLYRFGEMPAATESWSLAPSLLAAGIAYVIGHALQDGFSLTRLTTTAWLVKPNPVVRKLYCWFEREKWLAPSPPFNTPRGLESGALLIQNEGAKAELQRIVSLMMIGTTMAPCFLIGSLFVVWKWRAEGGIGALDWSRFDPALAVAGLGLSAVFWALGWIKNAQRTLFVASRAADGRSVQTSAESSKLQDATQESTRGAG